VSFKQATPLKSKQATMLAERMETAS